MKPLQFFLAGCLAACAVCSRAGDVVYGVRDLGALGGENSRALGINEAGLVVGEADTREGPTRAFLWTPESGMQDLGSLGGAISRAYAINDRSQVAGESEDAEGRMRPFLWQADSGMEALPMPDAFRDGFVYGMNNFGVLVGGGEREDGTRALVWSVDGVAIPAPLRELGSSLAHAVNDLGDLAGQAEALQGPEYVSRAFVLDARGFRLPATNGSSDWSSAALALSAGGHAVGYAERSNATHAARFAGDQPVEDLDTLANVYSVAHDVNDAGVAVGLFVSSHEDDDRAFVHRAGAMTDLNEMLETDEPWLIVEARGINNRGQIVGYGLLRERERAVLLEPQAAPGGPRARVRIAEPAAGSQFAQGEDVWLEAVVEPADAPIRRVTFLASGAVIGSATSAPFRLKWENPPQGTHHLVATAGDRSGRLHRSARAPFHVRGREEDLPELVLIEPDDGTALCVGSNLWIGAEAPGAEAGAYQLRLLLDGIEQQATPDPVARLDWRPAETGLFTWVAVLQAPGGRAITSAPARVHVTVQEE